MHSRDRQCTLTKRNLLGRRRGILTHLVPVKSRLPSHSARRPLKFHLFVAPLRFLRLAMRAGASQVRCRDKRISRRQLLFSLSLAHALLLVVTNMAGVVGLEPTNDHGQSVVSRLFDFTPIVHCSLFIVH